MSSTNKNLRVWDLPIRLFHWTLAILVTISIYTGLKGGFQEMDYHMLSGYAILALLLFRVCWGVIGSRPRVSVNSSHSEKLSLTPASFWDEIARQAKPPSATTLWAR